MEEQLTGIEWTTASGKVIDLANMGDQHLKNAYKLVVRKWPWREDYILPFAQEIKLRGLPWYGA
jgi:hypothetical protein